MPITSTNPCDEPKLSPPQWWFDEIVEPNFNEYISDPGCRRQAINAIVTTYHFCERLYHYRRQNHPDSLAGRNETEFKKDLVSKCPEFKVLGDVVNSVKHHVRLWDKKPSNIARTATGVTQDREDKNDLIIECTGKSVREVLQSVMSYWQTCLNELPAPPTEG